LDNDIVKRLVWAGLLALTGALASITARRGATWIWERVFQEEPPE
jgi:hypothetical protein